MSKYESAESYQLYCLTLRLCLGCGVVSLTDQILIEQVKWGWIWMGKIHTYKKLKILLWKKTLDCCQQYQCRWSSCQGCVGPLVGWESIVGCDDRHYVDQTTLNVARGDNANISLMFLAFHLNVCMWWPKLDRFARDDRLEVIPAN